MPTARSKHGVKAGLTQRCGPQLKWSFQNFPEGRHHLEVHTKNMNSQVSSQSHQSESPGGGAWEVAQKMLKSPGVDRCFSKLMNMRITWGFGATTETDFLGLG